MSLLSRLNASGTAHTVICCIYNAYTRNTHTAFIDYSLQCIMTSLVAHTLIWSSWNTILEPYQNWQLVYIQVGRSPPTRLLPVILSYITVLGIS